jgi:hypothetical protein
MGLLKRLYRMSRFMTKRQGGVLLPATTFVVLQTRQSNVKSAGAGVDTADGGKTFPFRGKGVGEMPDGSTILAGTVGTPVQARCSR